MDRRVTPHKRVNTSTWDPPPSCKQALGTKKIRVTWEFDLLPSA